MNLPLKEVVEAERGPVEAERGPMEGGSASGATLTQKDKY